MKGQKFGHKEYFFSKDDFCNFFIDLSLLLLRKQYKIMAKYTTATEALKVVKSGDRVFMHGSAATPLTLNKALTARASELRGVEIVSISMIGEAPFADPKLHESFHINSLFVSENIRKSVNDHDSLSSYVPIFLSEIPSLFRRNILPIDVALVHVSPPDNHGFCSLGVSVDIALSAVQTAKHIIAQVNPRMPRVLGDGIIHVSQIHSIVDTHDELPEVSYATKTSEAELQIGKYVAELIEDGSTLQMGIGSIPDAVLSCLQNHKDLGVHTEMFSDGVVDLVLRGVINNKMKKKHAGRLVTGFIMGTRKLYDFVDNNPQVLGLDIAYVNDTKIIRQNPKVHAINSAVEIDLTGQVCADSIGTMQFSGVGGQMDFIRGASLSEGGKPIIALPSVTNKGISRITPFLKEGAGVVTTRAHVHYIVTEYGVAYLFGKNLRQRAKELIRIAHPDHREGLEKAAHARFGSIY